MAPTSAIGIYPINKEIPDAGRSSNTASPTCPKISCGTLGILEVWIRSVDSMKLQSIPILKFMNERYNSVAPIFPDQDNLDFLLGPRRPLRHIALTSTAVSTKKEAQNWYLGTNSYGTDWGCSYNYNRSHILSVVFDDAYLITLNTGKCTRIATLPDRNSAVNLNMMLHDAS